jgi:hypothetical protein
MNSERYAIYQYRPDLSSQDLPGDKEENNKKPQ